MAKKTDSAAEETSAETTGSAPQSNPPNADSLIAMLQSENAALKKQVADLTASKALQDADEKIIVEKMSKGLTRAQAVSVIQRQRAYDASDLGKLRAKQFSERKAKAEKAAAQAS